MTKLSVNINKIATLRNARGEDQPNLKQMAIDIERFGAEGITVHPRPDQRHITMADTYALADIVKTEFNIEGYPDQRFLKIIRDIKPHQVTLVPDAPEAITSNTGWDTFENESFLKEVIAQLHEYGSRVSVFCNDDPKMVEGAFAVGADRIELYTGPYAQDYMLDPKKAVASFVMAAHRAKELGLGVNAGHDLDLQNLKYLKGSIPFLAEVSIGHALVCDALYYGMENTIQMYKRQLL
jgi:pyridoxine 5-phosphate synthase